MKALKTRTGRAAVASLALASLLMGASPALAGPDAAASIPVGEDGIVATDSSFDGPQVTEVRVINEGNFLEIYWDRYVDEEAAVSPDNLVLANGDANIALQAKPATGPELSYAWTSPSKTRLTFEAIDEGSGVAQIEYRINGRDWKTYTGEFRVRSRDLVEARAHDLAGNTSTVLTVNRRGH